MKRKIKGNGKKNVQLRKFHRSQPGKNIANKQQSIQASHLQAEKQKNKNAKKCQRADNAMRKTKYKIKQNECKKIKHANNLRPNFWQVLSSNAAALQ